MNSPDAAGARPGATAWERRRPRGAAPRRHIVPVRYNDDEYAVMLANAAAARLAPSAYIATITSTPASHHRAAPSRDAQERRADLLLELMGLHRQMRGAAGRLNQAVAKLHSLNRPVAALPSIAAQVRQVTTAVDALIAAITARR